MSKNSRLAFLSILVLIAVSFFFWYNVAPANDQPQPPTLAPLAATPPATADTEPDTPQELVQQTEAYFNGNWTIASESFLGYRLTQPSEDSEVVGRTTSLTGNAVIENNKVEVAQFSAPISSLTTGDNDVDAVFANDMIQVDSFPDLTLTIASMQLPDDQARAEDLAVTGTITIRDVAKEVAFTVDTQIRDDDKIELVAVIDILLSDYGVAQPSDLDTVYNDEAKVEAHLYFEKAS